MTPKEKAKELIVKYMEFVSGVSDIDGKAVELGRLDTVKQCVLIAVKSHLDYSENDSPFPTIQSWQENNLYWREVKEEIKIAKLPAPLFDIEDFKGRES